MKRLMILAVATAFTLSGCANLRNLGRDENPYESPFYAKYLNTGSTLDAQITRTLEAVRQNPGSADLHNQLGAMLLEKGFPKDAEREFERAVNADRKYFPAWYNLGLVRAASGDDLGARRAFYRTVDLKPGHAQALFQLGMIEEKRHHRDRAVKYYAKAFAINPALLRVEVNPRIVDTKLTHLALLQSYSTDHSRRTMQFHGVPVVTSTPSAPPPAASPQPPAKNIVTPAPPVTELGAEPTPVKAPSSASTPPPGRRSTRGRQPRPRPEAAQPQPESQPSTEVPLPIPQPPVTPPAR